MTTENPARTIRSKAPTRVDLAGGTLDIWPLYLFLKNPLTLNLGIDLYAETKVEEFEDGEGKVTLRADDQGAELSCTWKTLQDTSAPPSLLLHLRLLQLFVQKRMIAGHHSKNGSITLTTVARSPAGAGLGGSSALSVSMVGALASWAGSASNSETRINLESSGESWIDIVRDVETTVIQVPAGLQDYYGAMFGGLQALRWKPGKHERDKFPSEMVGEIEKRLLLFYSGQSRNSGINNWALFKAFIDREGQVRSQFEAIGAATRALEHSLRDKDWSGVEAAIVEEWEVRRTLARGISTPEMDYAFSLAKKLGAPSGKVCGAGGGGCFFVYVPSGDPALKDRIQKQITAQGIRSLPFKGVTEGLKVEVNRIGGAT